MRQASINWKAMLRGAGTAMVSAIVLCAGAAQLVSMGTVGEEWINYLAAGILLVASFAGGMMAAGSWEAIGSGAGLWLMLLGINGILCGFELHGGGETLLAILGGSGAAALLSLQKTATRHSRRKRRIVKLNKKLR